MRSPSFHRRLISEFISSLPVFLLSRFFRRRIFRSAMLTAPFIFSALPAAATVAALECSAKSGATKVAVLELYTSEGCNSCPPTDRWVSSLRTRNLVNERVIPLAFHVDYWNYIGWNDPYSDKKYSDRQRTASSRQGSSVIYTPQLVLNGKDLRGQQHGDFAGMLGKINQNMPEATISLMLNRADPAHYEVSGNVAVANPDHHQHAEAYVALIENNLVSDVKAGENRGVTLHHDFVVRELAGPFRTDADGMTALKKTFDVKRDWKAADTTLVAFVQNAKTGDVLQALALPACQ